MPLNGLRDRKMGKSKKKTRPKINMVKYTHMNMKLACGTSTNRIFLQFSKRKSFLLKALAFPLHGWLISPIWQYFSFWFIIAHATYEVLSLSQAVVFTVQCTHSTRSRAMKSQKNGKIFKHKRTNTMSCPNTTPDVCEFPLTACEYELFQATSICLPGSRFFPRSLLVSLW